MAEEEVVAVGADNESSMCKAGFASDEELFIDPIIYVVHVPEMAPLRDFFKSAPSGFPLPAPQEDELLTWQRGVCKGLGLPWPPPKAKAGKPNRQALWLRTIDAEVRAGRTLPDGVTAAVPCAWLPGDLSASTGVSPVEVVAAFEMANCQAFYEAGPRSAGKNGRS